MILTFKNYQNQARKMILPKAKQLILKKHPADLQIRKDRKPGFLMFLKSTFSKYIHYGIKKLRTPTFFKKNSEQ